MSLASQIRQSFETQDVITLKVLNTEMEKYLGVVMGVRKSFVILRDFRDLFVDGVLILPKRVIRGYRCGRFEHCASNIFRENGGLKKLKVPRWLDPCQTITDVLNAFNARDIWPVVEMKNHKGDYIGSIVDVSPDVFHLLDYDEDGAWARVRSFRVDEIIRIEFDDRYSTEFNRYMRAHHDEPRRQMLEQWHRRGANKSNTRQKGVIRP